MGLEFPSEQFTLGTDSCIEPIEVAVQSAHASPVGLKCARHVDADLVGSIAGYSLRRAVYTERVACASKPSRLPGGSIGAGWLDEPDKRVDQNKPNEQLDPTKSPAG